MTTRTYLSIGDVLTLLREEFPDVTISKIRFLESQGLVNPERSPSGYRKFFEGDVERLRWVLRQQREHFLPLKVIRDRLDNGDWTSDAEATPVAAAPVVAPVAPAAHSTPVAPVAPVAPGNGKVAAESTHVGSSHSASPAGPASPASPAGRARTAGAISAAGAAAAAAATAPVPRTQEQSAQAGDEAMARILADASRRSSRAPEGAPLVEAGSAEGAAAAAAESAAAVAPAPPVAPSPPEDGPPTAQTPRIGTSSSALPRQPISAALPPPGGGRGHTMVPSHMPSAGTPRVPSPSGGAGVVPGATPDVGSAASAASTAGSAPTGGLDGGANAPGRREEAEGTPEKATARSGGKATAASGTKGTSSTTSVVTGASLTTQELCAASGLSEIELAGLQGFGLIEPVMVAGIPTFDEDALTVANLAAEFRKYGIEARHLRPYRNAVDREMGLIEQVIIPLLRQRNPESRQRAVDAADELGALGQTMRATLMRTALKRHVGG